MSAPVSYAGVRALVLGASGFIGGRVARALVARGADVLLAGRDDRSLRATRAALGNGEPVVCDVTDANAVADLVRGARPAVTFNLAGYGIDRRERDEAASYRVNAELPSLLAELLAALRPSGWQGQALVHAGSALEYGTAGGDLRETTMPVPTTLYGKSKLEGTRAIAAHARWSGLAAVTARLFTVYGPGEHDGRLLPALLDAARSATQLDLTAGRQLRDFTFVDDVADGLLRLGAAAAAPGEIINVATGELTTVRDFALRTLRVLGADPALLRFGAVPTRAEEMAHEPIAVDRLREVTGWVPSLSIEEGVTRTAAESLAAVHH